MDNENGININPQQLETCVARALNETGVRVGEWQAKLLHGGLEVNTRLYLLSGQAQTASGERPWSLVLKTVLYDPAADTTPQAVHYWKREASFYESGMLENLDRALVPPRCYLVSQEAVRTQIWMEALEDALPKPWSKEHLPEVARHLGCFNGSFLAGKPLPEAPWFARKWLRGYTELAALVMDDLAEFRNLPYFQGTYPDMTDEFLLEAWGRRGEFLELLEGFPQTLCHQDAFERNLFYQDGRLIAID